MGARLTVGKQVFLERARLRLCLRRQGSAGTSPSRVDRKALNDTYFRTHLPNCLFPKYHPACLNYVRFRVFSKGTKTDCEVAVFCLVLEERHEKYPEELAFGYNACCVGIRSFQPG